MSEAVYSLIGVVIGGIIGGAVAILNTYMANRANVRLARLNIHERRRMGAYKKLLAFSHSLFVDPSNDIENTRRDFVAVMRRDFYTTIFPDYFYYTPKIRQLLGELKGQYDFWGHPDFWDLATADAFLNDRLNPIADELQRLSIKQAEV